MTKERLEGIKRDLEEGLNSISLDFLRDYDLTSSSYLSDAFTEYADGATSIYYSDQRAYFNEHSTECEDALLELYDKESIANIIKERGLDSLLCLAGACGEYNANYADLSEDEENITKLLVIRWLLKNDIFTLEESELAELLDEAADYRNDRISDLLDLVNEKLEEEK